MEKKYTIYAFIQSGEILYIGMTNDPKKRIAQQIRNGKTGIPQILYSGLTKNRAMILEKILIKKYRPISNVRTYVPFEHQFMLKNKRIA